MNKTKHSVIAMLLTVVFLAVGAFCMTACGEKTPKQALTWETNGATVAVEGYDSLPAEVDQGSIINFTVTPATGYTVDSVMAYLSDDTSGKKITQKNGVYNYTVNADVKIVINIVEKVESIAITTNPTNLSYFAGDAFDPTGMVVSASYATGKTETVTDYKVVPSVFNGGETQVKITYGDAEVYLDLDGRVEYLVTINPNGGTISESYLSNLQAKGLNNYAVADNGVITFSYWTDLEGSVDLPGAADISRENSNFKGWSYSGSISAATPSSVVADARWELIIANMTKVQLVEENGVPYLVIDATFNFAGEFCLYLYEGNAQVSIDGDKYNGAQGDVFQVKYDLFRLAEGTAEDGGSFEGKWMDIRLKAIVDGNEETQEILVTDKNIQVDQSQKIFANNEKGSYSFLFATYENALKVYYNVVDYTFTYDLAVEEGVPYLNVHIVGLSKYAGATAQLSAWTGSAESEPVGATISTGGEATIKVDLTQFPQAANGYFHFGVVDAQNNSLFGGTDTNLKIAMCTTTIPTITKGTAGGDITNAIKLTDNNGVAYYVGYAWDGLMYYIKDEVHALEYTGVTLEKVDGKVYYVISGTAAGYDTITFKYDYQHNNNIDGMGWGYEYIDAEGKFASAADGEGDIATMTVTADVVDGKWKVYLPASDIGAGMADAEKWVFTVHFGMTNKADLKMSSSAAWVMDGIKYSVLNDADTTWGNTAFVMEKTDEADTTVAKEYAVAGFAVVNDNDKPYFVVTVNYQGYTAEEIKAISWLFDLQANSNINNDGNWTRYLTEVKPVVTVNATNVTLAWDISELPSKAFTMHLGVGTEGDAPDFKPTEAFSNDTVIGNKTYNVRCVPGSNAGADFWGNVGLTITEIGTPTVTVASVELVQEGDKVYYVVKGAYENLTADQAAAMYVELEIDKNDYATGKVVTTAANGAFEIKVDVTDFEAGKQYWPHIHFAEKSNVISYEAAMTLTVGGKTYALEMAWSNTTLKVTAA